MTLQSVKCFVFLFILVLYCTAKHVRHHKYRYDRKRSLKSSISNREIFNQIQRINPGNCASADEADTTLDVKLEYSRWDPSTLLALYIANKMTTRIEQENGLLEPNPDSYFFNLVKQAVITGRPVVFGSAAIFGPRVFTRHDLFSAFAFYDKGDISVSNTADEVDFTQNESYQKLAKRNWKNVKEILTKTKEGDVTRKRKVLYATKDDGIWTKPYFDCGGGNVWMVTYLAPVFGRGKSGAADFKGVGTIDVAINNLDVNQCDADGKSIDAFLNAFRGTHRCPSYTKCIFKPGFGLRPGGYNCVAKNGCTLTGSHVEKASRRNLWKMARMCRRYRKNKGHKKRYY